MAQSNESNHSFDSINETVKRKRGRPRKERVRGTQANSQTQRRRDNSLPASRTTNNIVNDDLVGKEISGTLEGSFDSGHLLTIRVNGTLLRGMVFDSRVAVPITASNDVAPNLKMLMREEFLRPAAISAEPLQSREPLITKAPKNVSVQVSPVLNSNAEDAAKVQRSDGQTQGVTANEVIGELKSDPPSKTIPIKESSNEKKLELLNEIPSQTFVPELDFKEVVLIDNVSHKNASATVPESAATQTLNPSSYSQMFS